MSEKRLIQQSCFETSPLLLHFSLKEVHKDQQCLSRLLPIHLVYLELEGLLAREIVSLRIQTRDVRVLVGDLRVESNTLLRGALKDLKYLIHGDKLGVGDQVFNRARL